jgi:hypothetical protein
MILKKTHMKTKLTSFLNETITPIMTALVMAGAFQAGAQYIVNDDFESYPDQATFEDPFTGGWFDVAGSGLLLSTERSIIPSATGLQSAKVTVSTQRSAKNLPVGYELTASSEVHAKITFYTFATNAPTTTTGPSRIVAGVTTAANGTPTLMGWFNSANAFGQTFNGNLFQGRCDYAGTTAYFNLTNAGTPTRSQAVNKWIKFDIERLTNGVTRYYVNDVLGITVPSTNGAWGAAAMGFGLGTQAGDAWFDGFSISTNHPYVITQPVTQYPSLGGSATFTVTAIDAVTYQWRKNATNDIAGATSSSLTINPVSASDAAFYSVVCGNSAGTIGSLAAQLIIGPPSIQSQTTNASGLEAGVVKASVTASGAPTLTYQWYLGDASVSGATTSQITVNPFTQATVGAYKCVVTNTFGSVTSSPVTVTMITNLYPTAMTPLWTKLPGDYPWLTTSGSATRSLAYNALSNQVIVASRTGATNIIVLSADTGAFLYNLANPATFVGGLYPINKVATDDDGAVYVANLSLNGTTDPFKIYKYANTDPLTAPTPIYSGDPGAGVAERWGDAMDARGSGASVQILITSRLGTNACVFTTDGLGGWTANLINCNVKPADIGSGCVFGVEDTFWGKCNDSTNGLFRIAFDKVTQVGTVLNVYTNVPQAVTSIGINKDGCFLMANEFTTIDAARLYDVSDYTVNPILVDWAFYTSRNTGYGAGNLVIFKDRVWSIEDNNGILAQKINWPAITYSVSGTDLILNWVGKYMLRSSTDLNGAWSTVPGPVTAGPYSTPLTGNKYFQLKY